ncbi:hypothetical protein V8E55_010170 [Tylopilus felleus]
MTGASSRGLAASMLSVGQDRSLPIEIETSGIIKLLTFSANGRYLVGGTSDGHVQVWRVKDGKLVATLPERVVGLRCLAVSKDDKWIVTAGQSAVTIVWDARTYERVFRYHKEDILGIDFSPDSTRFVGASWEGAIVLNLPNCEQVQTLEHTGSYAEEAKYSPRGDRIATVSREAVRIWDSNGDARLLVEIAVEAASSSRWDNNDLIWFDDHLFVTSGSTIKQFDASTGSAISEWTVPNTDRYSWIALSHRGAFIAHATDQTVSLWDTPTHSQLVVNNYADKIHSVALSPHDEFLAISQGKKISIKSLPRIIDSIPMSRLDPTLQEPDIQINDSDDVFSSWKHDQLATAEALLTSESSNPSHHLLINRALVRARLEEWDAALIDAETAINMQPSVMGYVAKSIAHVGLGERYKGYHTCDIAFERFHSSHGTFIRLMKAIVVFMAGEHQDAISRVGDLIDTVPFPSICYVVQAHMYLLVGNLLMERSDHDGAIQSLEHARAQLKHYGGRPLFVIPLISGWKLNGTDTTIRQSLCEALYAADRIKDAVECFHQMARALGEEVNVHHEHLEWARDFSQRSSKNLEYLGDAAMDAKQYDEAISHYTIALSLNQKSPEGILVKRKKAFVATGSWKQALDAANEAIAFNPSSPWGYEMKHAALHEAGEYKDAVHAFEAMLSMIAQYPDLDIQRYGDQFVSPSSVQATIRKIVQRTIRHMPRVLINTKTGHLYDKTEQASAFESLPIFNQLVSSMTTRTDHVRIKREVRQYFRYAMLSHKWEMNEPLFQQVIDQSVYSLDKSATHDKLQTFCKIVRDAGFEWTWSDTCCINKLDHFVLQEALVAMFEWYEGSAMVIVFLRGVRSWSQLGALMQNVWNTRVWTLQEYIAAKVVRFYTEDWTPYLNLQVPNHKESPEVISEMEEATGVSAEGFMALRPGLTNIREKLRLASTRHTTLVEDAAYSLLGIFSVTGIPAIYGEGDGSLGRLLSHVVTVSGDASNLAWTGESGSFNSCLPAQITVFKGPATSHLPLPMSDNEAENIITASHTSSFDRDAALKLYDRLSELPAPWFAASRMKLPCIAFQLPPLTPYRTRSGRIYRVNTITFGLVEIKTRHELSRMQPLYLVHPWLDTVLDRGAAHRGMMVEDDVAPPPTPDTDDEEILDEEIEDDSAFLPEPELPPLPAPSQAITLADRETRARRLAARFRQPFGALLLTLATKGRIGIDYRRVAADSMITVQFQESVSLTDLLDNVRTFDVL